jgi:thioredoxin
VSDDARPSLVFFRSERSGPARRMDSLIAHVERTERSRVRIRRVDVHPDLAKRFGVVEVPTLVLVKDRQIVDRIDGRASAPQIERMLAAHMAGELVGAAV